TGPYWHLYIPCLNLDADFGYRVTLPADVGTGSEPPTPVVRTFKIGRALPLGAVPDTDGVNFSVFSQHATKVELLLFDTSQDEYASQVWSATRTGHYWHVYVEGLGPGAIYAYRVTGPNCPDDLRH